VRVGLGSAVVCGGIVLASLTTAPAVGTTEAPGTAAPPDAECDRAQSVPGAFYPGRAASAVYESLFARGFAIPHLATHVPQGIATWRDWNGDGQDILVVAMYRKVGTTQESSYLVAIDPATGTHLATVAVAGGHLGGIAIAGGYLFGQHRDRPSPTEEPIRRYRLDRLAAMFEEAAATGTLPYLGRERGLQTLPGAGFMHAYRGEIWAGHYNADRVDKVYRYTVDATGRLVQKGGSYQAPARTQGILVTSDRLIFSVAKGNEHGRIVVAERRHRLSAARQRCFVSPSMGENMARVGNRVFLVFEGGSYKYQHTTNRIADAHVADLTALRAL